MTDSSAGQLNIVGRRLASVLTQTPILQLSSTSYLQGDSIVLIEMSHAYGFSGGGAAADSEALSNHLGCYVNGLFGFTDKSSTEKEDGFESDSAGIAIGVDYL